MNESLQALVEFTPLYYDQGGEAVDGIDWGPVLGRLAAAVVLTGAAWRRFQRRDIRVGGERSWRWRDMFRRKRAAA